MGACMSGMRRKQSPSGNLDGMSQFNCFLVQGCCTICLTFGVLLSWAGAPGFWLVIPIIWIFFGWLCARIFYVRQEKLSDIKTGEGAETGK